LPKSCGNTRSDTKRGEPGFRGERQLLAGFFAVTVAACGQPTDTTTLRLSTHALPGCAPPLEARLRLSALGDFATTETTSEDLPLGGTSELVVPAATLAFEAAVEAGGERFIGYAELEPDGAAALLLWPEARGCVLDGPRSYPAPGGGQALGYAPGTGTLLLAGGSAVERPSASVGALSFDAGTGRISSEESSPASLREPRAFATVTQFGDSLLVAGGENPLHGDGEWAVPRKTAEVYRPQSASFASSIELVEERSRHAALLLKSGSVLLVGGRGAASDALRVLELVDPAARRSSIAGLTALSAPRISPSALTLDDGRLFIGGGSAADGTPLSALEWLSSDAREHLGAVFPPGMPARYDRAFTALPGGGVLAVGGCEARSARDGDEQAECQAACREGCPPLTGYDAWWIAASGEVHELPFDLPAPRPVLLGGGDGAPLLASGAPGDDRLYRFDPWRAEFDLLDLELPGPPPRAGLPALSLDVEAFAWLAETADRVLLQGLRLGTRNRYSRDVFLVTQSDPKFPERPLHLVPDRPLAGSAGYDGALWFSTGSPVVVYVAATDYADLSLSVHFDGAAPRVVLGSAEFGGEACPWPESDSSPVVLVRNGDTVRLSVAGQAVTCAADGGRVRVGLAAPVGAETRISRVDLSRGNEN
jgi:hypothetical protein